MAQKQGYGSNSFRKFKKGTKKMGKAKYAMKKFFRSGLKLIGEKKVFQKNYAVTALSVSSDATYQTIAWTCSKVPFDEII